MYVFKNKESGLYLVLSLNTVYDDLQIHSSAMSWYVSETDEISCASKFISRENIEYLEDYTSGLTIYDWEAECVEL